jgi:uncharacterized protein DUF5658
MACRLTPAAACLLIGNLVDALGTLAFVELGLASESNPLLRWAYDASPLLFMMGKLALVQGAVLLVAAQEPAFRIVSRVGAALYGAVIAYQVGFLLMLR